MLKQSTRDSFLKFYARCRRAQGAGVPDPRRNQEAGGENAPVRGAVGGAAIDGTREAVEGSRERTRGSEVGAVSLGRYGSGCNKNTGALNCPPEVTGARVSRAQGAGARGSEGVRQANWEVARRVRQKVRHAPGEPPPGRNRTEEERSRERTQATTGWQQEITDLDRGIT